MPATVIPMMDKYFHQEPSGLLGPVRLLLPEA